MIEKPQGPGVSNLAARRGEELTLEFMSSCETALLAQYDRFELYGALCKQSGVHRDDLSTAVRNRDLARVPSIPTGLFKRSKSLLADLNDLEQPDGTWLRRVRRAGILATFSGVMTTSASCSSPTWQRIRRPRAQI